MSVQTNKCFCVGDRVLNLRERDDEKYRWRIGVVIMEVPAGVIPMALYRRWLKDKGVCKISEHQSPVMHKERYIVRVEREGKYFFYCPSPNMMEKVRD